MTGTDLPCPCSLGFYGKEFLLFQLPNDQIPQAGSSSGRHRKEVTAQLSPARVTAVSLIPLLQEEPWGRRVELPTNPSAQGKGSDSSSLCHRNAQRTQIRQQHSKGREGRFSSSSY